MIQRTKEVLVRRITVKNAILNRRFAERNLCDINSRMKQQLQADAQKINMYLSSVITAQAPSNAKHKK